MNKAVRSVLVGFTGSIWKMRLTGKARTGSPCLSKKGYNAFALIYRPGARTACEDLSRAVVFLTEHADGLPAPAGMNRKPCRFHVVRNKEDLYYDFSALNENVEYEEYYDNYLALT